VHAHVRHARHRDPFLEQGAKQIIKDLPTVSKDKLSIDYYYWYYATIAINQFDGPRVPRRPTSTGVPWNEAMKDAIISLQDTSNKPDVCSRGGWLVGDRWCHYGGPIYATAINTLTLEVYYRYPNASARASVVRPRPWRRTSRRSSRRPARSRPIASPRSFAASIS